MIISKKPKICFVYDTKGWAFYNQANYLKKHLNDFYKIDVIRYDTKIYKEYDVIIEFSYRAKLTPINYKITICGSSSHKENINNIGLNKYKTILLNDDILYNKSKHENKFYIPNGIDVGVFDSEKNKKIDKKNINIGAVGSLKYSNWKGKERIESICLALSKLGYNVNNKSLFIDPKKDKFNQSQMVSYYDDIDIFLVSSFSETGPNPLLEAMSMKIPTISNNVGLAPKLIEDGISGFLIEDYNDIEEYISKIIKLIECDELYKKISIESRMKVLEYDWKFISLRYKEMIDDFIENK